MVRGLFVTGTDTDVGKTAVAAAILRQLRAAGQVVGAYKPVASGAAAAGGDAAALWEAAGRPLSLEAVCPQAFAAAIAPHRAARAEGRVVDERLLRAGFEPWRAAGGIVVVEGAGGLFSPLGDATLNVDLARGLGLPLVIVDAARLGAIGRSLALVRAARAEGLVVAAVVLSQVLPLQGRPDDPTSTVAIARDSLADLAARLPGTPVAMLAHGAARIEPAVAWETLSGDP
jgi:dethiobiotin synthetase